MSKLTISERRTLAFGPYIANHKEHEAMYAKVSKDEVNCKHQRPTTKIESKPNRVATSACTHLVSPGSVEDRLTGTKHSSRPEHRIQGQLQ